MASPTKSKNIKEEKTKEKPKEQEKEQELESLVRISSYDIPGSKNLYAGLTRIKGVSWAVSNAICISLGLDRKRRISDLSKDEIKKIEKFLEDAQMKEFLINRRKDLETGKTKHYVGSSLDMKKDFDIRRMKKIRSYKGVRHTAGQPVRGQRTRSHFRSRGKAVGVKRKTR